MLFIWRVSIRPVLKYLWVFKNATGLVDSKGESARIELPSLPDRRQQSFVWRNRGGLRKVWQYCQPMWENVAAMVRKQILKRLTETCPRIFNSLVDHIATSKLQKKVWFVTLGCSEWSTKYRLKLWEKMERLRMIFRAITSLGSSQISN